MSQKLVFRLAFLLSLLVEFSTAQNKKFVCSYSPSKAAPIGYQPEFIPLEVCPYVIFKAFSFPSVVGRQMLFNDNDKLAFSRLVSSVRKRSNTVRVVASIDGSARDFTTTSSAIVRRKAFVQAAITLLLELDADAIELNWQSPGNSGVGSGDGLDRITMVQLLQDLRQAVNAASKSIQNRQRELWFRGSLHPNVIETAYNLLDVCELTDHVTLDPNTADSLENAHAPLRGTPQVLPVQIPIITQLFGNSIEPGTGFNTTTQRWIDAGCAPKKLLLGIGLHGVRKAYSPGIRSFLGDRVGFMTADTAYLEHRELCTLIKEEGWSYAWDEYGGMPYVTRALQNGQTERISYEDLDSLRLKMDMVTQKRFGGIYVDFVHSDDIYGRCGQAYLMIAYLSSRVRSIPSDIGFAIEWIQ
uniref:GH18 domain-containing protein n=1 Tax=Anopheles epiroticus TaxID=199890 RepID=A0A182P4L3_9DIPT